MDYYEKRDWYPELEGLPVHIDFEKSEIRKFYDGGNIFITGGAGFLGGLLVEKIVRSIPNFGKIYLLLRPKKGLSPSQRLSSLFDDDVFGLMKKKNPDFISKIILMEGDLCEPMCGLSEENQRIIREDVNMVFHIAACLRMAEPLKGAYEMNVRATKDLLDLATNMKQLKGFVYVSTAYSNCFRPEIDETFYETPYNWKNLQDFAQVATEEQLQSLTPILLGPWVNTYSFTKAICEDMVKMYVGRIPVAIARPSIVIGCAREPLTNWINNVYGVTGVTAAACIGVMRVWLADPNKVADIIPADYVVNTMIAIPWKICRQFEAKSHVEEPIYNIVSSPKATTTWGEYTLLSSRGAIESLVVSGKALSEYAFTLVKDRRIWHLLFLLFHLGQALIVDTALILQGKQPMLFQAYNKIMRFNLSLSFFCVREWKYEQPHVDDLLAEMNEDDKKLFPFDMTGFGWHAYHLTTVRAIFRYIVKSNDDVENPTAALARYMRMVNIRKAVVAALGIPLAYTLVCLIGRIALRLFVAEQCTT